MNALHHIGIEVSDLYDSLQFYQHFFEAKIEDHFFLNGEEIVFLQLDSFFIELVHLKEMIGKKRVSSIHFAIKVPDLITKISSLNKKGFLPSEGPYHLNNGFKVVFYQGPDGEIIELIESVDPIMKKSECMKQSNKNSKKVFLEKNAFIKLI